MSHTLVLILLLLAAAVVAIIVCRLVRLPPILGYLAVGIAVGPHAMGWVPDNANVRDLAEFGIVFLMFSIGLEFSLPQLNTMRRAVFGLGLAALTELAGLSFALGAFLAGMLIAETEYRYQVEEDIKPFRDVLLGLFFVTVGMYLDLRVVGANLGWVMLLLVAPVASKLILIVILARIFGAPLGAAL